MGSDINVLIEFKFLRKNLAKLQRQERNFMQEYALASQSDVHERDRAFVSLCAYSNSIHISLVRLLRSCSSEKLLKNLGTQFFDEFSTVVMGLPTISEIIFHCPEYLHYFSSEEIYDTVATTPLVTSILRIAAFGFDLLCLLYLQTKKESSKTDSPYLPEKFIIFYTRRVICMLYDLQSHVPRAMNFVYEENVAHIGIAVFLWAKVIEFFHVFEYQEEKQTISLSLSDISSASTIAPSKGFWSFLKTMVRK